MDINSRQPTGPAASTWNRKLSPTLAFNGGLAPGGPAVSEVEPLASPACPP